MATKNASKKIKGSIFSFHRETLVRATLPNFHLPAAVEVLTLGQYTRVPRCVRERIVPPEPISAHEKRLTLLRINQVSGRYVPIGVATQGDQIGRIFAQWAIVFFEQFF
jgi:hypothetical protein